MGRFRGFAAGILAALVIILIGAAAAMAYMGGFADFGKKAIKNVEAAEEAPVTEEKQASEVSLNDGLHKNAEFTYEFYNETTNTTDTMNGECPQELVGRTMSEVKAYYSDWQVISFSNDNVLLRKTIGARDEERYVISVYDECVAVFYENSEDGIYMQTDIPVSGLEHDVQVMLNDGIYVEGKDRLRRILEDYSS